MDEDLPTDVPEDDEEELRRGGRAIPTANSTVAASSPAQAPTQTQQPKGMVEPGNINLNGRPVLHNPDGTISSERSFSIGTDKGETLIPRIFEGKDHSEQEAIDHYRQTGEHMGIFDSPENADAYAERAHSRNLDPNASHSVTMLPNAGTTEDLENQGLASHLSRPIPTANSSVADAGTTEDLENKGLASHLGAHSLPIRAGVAGLWTKADNIHNPFLRVLGKIGAGAARAIDTAGTIVAPGIAGAIPGSTMNRAIQTRSQTADEDRQAKLSQEEATTAKTTAEQKNLESETKARDNAPDKAAKDPFALWMEQNPNHPVSEYFKAQQENKPTAESSLDKQYNDAIAAGDHETATRILKVKSDLARAGQAPERPPQSLMVVPGPNGTQQVINAKPGMTIAGNAEKPGEAAAANRREVIAHDKAYVQPAENVEKSYQMMDSAYKEYLAAKAQGKDLPTGAQSMLALSTHLATTFGNVKGSRVTKDMIQEHLGARGVSDSALVAFQRLTNGDVLSPDQWKAFHDLIGESRKLSWQTATKEAERKHIPVDFLPKDLQGGGGNDGDLKPPKEPDAGMKWQHRTIEGKTQWRQVSQ